MNPVEANEAAGRLLELFPSLTPEQVSEWAGTLERFDRPAADVAMTRHYRESTDGFVKPAGLVELLNIEQLRRNGGKREEERRRDEMVRQRSWELVKATVARVPADALAAHRTAVLETLPQRMKERLSRSEVRDSPMLMALVYERMRGGVKHE